MATLLASALSAFLALQTLSSVQQLHQSVNALVDMNVILNEGAAIKDEPSEQPVEPTETDLLLFSNSLNPQELAERQAGLNQFLEEINDDNRIRR